MWLINNNKSLTNYDLLLFYNFKKVFNFAKDLGHFGASMCVWVNCVWCLDKISPVVKIMQIDEIKRGRNGRKCSTPKTQGTIVDLKQLNNINKNESVKKN